MRTPPHARAVPLDAEDWPAVEQALTGLLSAQPRWLRGQVRVRDRWGVPAVKLRRALATRVRSEHRADAAIWIFVRAAVASRGLLTTGPSLRHLPRLSDRIWGLDLRASRGLLDLSPVEDAPRLYSLSIHLDQLAALRRCPPVETLCVAGPSDRPWRLPERGIPPTVRFLVLEGAVESVEALGALEGLSSLTIGVTPASLRGLPPSLRDLHVEQGAALRSLRELSTLPKLRRLSLGGMRGLVSLDGLGGLTALDSVALRDAGSVRTLDGLGPLPALSQLELRDLDLLEGLEGHRGLSALQRLSLDGLPRLRNLAGVRSLPALRWLTLRRLPATATLDLEELPLQALTLADLALKSADALPRGLRWLAMEGVEVADLSALAALPGLTDLTLGRSPPGSALLPLTHLHRIHLQQELPLRPLLEHPSLEVIWARDRRLTKRDITSERLAEDPRILAALPGLGAEDWPTVKAALDPLLLDPELRFPLTSAVGRSRFRLKPVVDSLLMRSIRPELRDTATLWIAARLRCRSFARLTVEPGVRELPAMHELGRIERLSLAKCQRVHDLSPLAGLASLRELLLQHAPVRDLRPIARLPALRLLHLWGCPGLPDQVRRLWRDEEIADLWRILGV